MAQALTRAQNRKARSLPRSSGEAVSLEPVGDELDWEGFVAAYFPESRRHDLEALVAYGAYKRSLVAGNHPAPEAARSSADASSFEATAVEEWEDEGGASQ